ncbi:creatininase family protein [Halorientalis salina]|uniref:creatininase family protein n=1 Tax=Halorientalis salina TaxID=2932266 RepID=UPI0010AD138C|nr:creatininase family protein [Halorientalis salina]
MHLAEATWTDAADVDTDLAVLPVGSTEQHGPHAPLGTDFLTADAIAGAGADEHESRTDQPVVVAPPITIGIAEEHRQFTGTLWVSEDTFRDYVRETIESLASHGWHKIVVVNGHGGNTAALRELCGQVTRHTDAYAVSFTWFDAVDPDDIDMGHGGPLETSVLQHLHPDLVDEDRLDEAGEGAAEGWGEFQSGTNLAYDSAEFSENGAVGDPSDGSKALGETIFDEAVGALAALLDRVAARDRGLPEHR